MLAVAGVVPALQLGNHLLQARRLRVERGDVLRGQPFDLARVPRRVFLQPQQGGDLLQGKPTSRAWRMKCSRAKSPAP